MLLNNECVNQEIKEEIKKYTETNINENTMIQKVYHAEKAVLIRLYSNTGLPQTTRKIPN